MKAATLLGRLYLLALFVFIFAPIAASVVFSFNSDRFPTLPLGHFTTDWYARAFSRPEVWQAIGNSLIVAAVTSVVATFIGFATAYTDFRYGFRFKQA
ncbi:MAG: ABC transporter permease, partial [Paracoccaceae bacterium]